MYIKYEKYGSIPRVNDEESIYYVLQNHRVLAI